MKRPRPLVLSARLTDPGFHAAIISQTYEGQAHFGGTGPATTCATCNHWNAGKHREAGCGVTPPQPRSAECAKFFELTRKHGPPVPARASACRHWIRWGVPAP